MKPGSIKLSLIGAAIFAVSTAHWRALRRRLLDKAHGPACCLWRRNAKPLPRPKGKGR